MRPPLLTDSHGFDYRSTDHKETQHDTHYHRPWVFQSGDLSTNLRYYYGSRNHTTVHGSHLLMVQTTREDHQQLGSSLHFTFQSRAYQETGYWTKPINSVPPTDQWPLRMKEPVDRTILTSGPGRPTRTMG